jgi:hypothetical protein
MALGACERVGEREKKMSSTVEVIFCDKSLPDFSRTRKVRAFWTGSLLFVCTWNSGVKVPAL